MASELAQNSIVEEFTLREERLIQENKDLKKEKDDLEKLCQQYYKEFTKTKIDYEELTKKCVKKDSEAKKLKKKNNHKMKFLEIDNQDKQAKIDSHEERFKKLEESDETLKTENETLKKENEILKQKIEKLQKRVEELEEHMIGMDNNDNNQKQLQEPQQLPWIATEFLRLVHEFFARELRARNTELRRIQYSNTLRIDTIKERVISNLGDDKELKKIIKEKSKELPSEIFQPWFSDFLLSNKCSKIFSTSYEAAITEITDSSSNDGIKEDALKVIGYLRDMYDKLGEPFGGNKSINDQGDEATGLSPPKRRRRTSETGGN